MTLTPTRQRNSVSEGIALGLVLLGHFDLPFDKVTADLAFTGAWRSWTYTSRFPQIQTDLAHGARGGDFQMATTGDLNWPPPGTFSWPTDKDPVEKSATNTSPPAKVDR